MSRDLPAQANIEHLKKQAKERLLYLLRSKPQTKLTDAQHEIAREYGFASWPKLRAHVESRGHQEDQALAMAPPSLGGGGGHVAVESSEHGDYQFGRFTPKAKQALFFSRYEASQVGSLVIEPEHVLLGLLRAGQGMKSGVLERTGLSLVTARAELAPAVAVREPVLSSVEIPFSDSTKIALRAATAEADRLVHHRVGIAHVVLGLLHSGGSEAASILRKKGVHPDAVRQGISASLDEESA